MDLRLIVGIVHLIGFALGLGGATMSDILFFKSLRNKKLTSENFGTLETLSKVIWSGLGLLILSGSTILYLIYSNQGTLGILSSPRFQAKLTLVAIILLNGLLFKFLILPFLRQNTEQMMSMQNIGKKLWLISFSGAVSIVSWYSVLVLSSLPRTFQHSYLYFIGIYLVVVLIGIVVGKTLIRRIIK